MTLDQQHWQDRLDALADKHGIVGATFAVRRGDEVATAATGVLNIRTTQPASPDSLFQIGSITKVWTATLVMQLVDEGLLDLDAPVVTYLPSFRVADDDVTRTVTTRHLLSHTSGIDGDLFLDTGRGDDCLEKYVAAMAELRQNHPMGATMSYCNSGYSLLGRLVEVLRGASWDVVVKERLLAPLGLSSAGTLPEEALLYGAATGHVSPPGTTDPVVTPQWGIYRSAGPAGLLHMTARDLLVFAQLHLDGGVTGDGTRVLSEDSAVAMLVPQVEVPDRWLLGSHWGLGWILMDWDGNRVYGHDGATLGQGGFLRILPAGDDRPALSVSLICNGGHMRDLFESLFAEVFGELADVAMPSRPEPPPAAPEFDPAAYVGRYSREGAELDVQQTRSGGLAVTMRSSGPLARPDEEPPVLDLVPFLQDVFLARLPGEELWMPAVFFTLDDGSRYLHVGARSTPKTG